MRKLLGTLAFVILVIAGLGLFRGWLSVSSETEEGKRKLEITIDEDQLKQDTSKLKDGAQGIADRFSKGEGAADPAGAEVESGSLDR